MKRLLSMANLRIGIEIILVISVLTFAFTRSAPTPAAAEPPASRPPLALLVPVQRTGNPACRPLYQPHPCLLRQLLQLFRAAPALSTSIHWFAFPTSPDSAEASRFLSLFQSSTISGTIFVVGVRSHRYQRINFRLRIK